MYGSWLGYILWPLTPYRSQETIDQPAATTHSDNAVLMLAQRHRRWLNIKTALFKCFFLSRPVGNSPQITLMASNRVFVGSRVGWPARPRIMRAHKGPSAPFHVPLLSDLPPVQVDQDSPASIPDYLMRRWINT